MKEIKQIKIIRRIIVYILALAGATTLTIADKEYKSWHYYVNSDYLQKNNTPRFIIQHKP